MENLKSFKNKDLNKKYQSYMHLEFAFLKSMAGAEVDVRANDWHLQKKHILDQY